MAPRFNEVDIDLDGQRQYVAKLKALINSADFSKFKSANYCYSHNDFFVESDAQYYRQLFETVVQSE
jgi:hypothetical protein